MIGSHCSSPFFCRLVSWSATHETVRLISIKTRTNMNVLYWITTHSRMLRLVPRKTRQHTETEKERKKEGKKEKLSGSVSLTTALPLAPGATSNDEEPTCVLHLADMQQQARLYWMTRRANGVAPHVLFVTLVKHNQRSTWSPRENHQSTATSRCRHFSYWQPPFTISYPRLTRKLLLRELNATKHFRIHHLEQTW